MNSVTSMHLSYWGRKLLILTKTKNIIHTEVTITVQLRCYDYNAGVSPGYVIIYRTIRIRIVIHTFPNIYVVRMCTSTT